MTGVELGQIQGSLETVSREQLQIGAVYRLHFIGKGGQESVTVDASYIFGGEKEGRLKFAVLFDGRMRTSKRGSMMPNHLDLPEVLFNRGVLAEPISSKPYNPGEAQDLIAGLPPRL